MRRSEARVVAVALSFALIAVVAIGSPGPVASAASGELSLAAGGNEPATEDLVTLSAIDDTTVDETGNLYVAHRSREGGGFQLLRFPPGSTRETPVGDVATLFEGRADWVYGMAVTDRGFIVVHTQGRSLEVLNPDGSTTGAELADLDLFYNEVAALPDALYFTRESGVWRAPYDPDTGIPDFAAVGSVPVIPTEVGYRPQDIAGGPDGDLFVSFGDASVRRFDTGDLPLATALGSSTDADYPGVTYIAGDATGSGPENRLAVDAAGEVFVRAVVMDEHAIVRIPPPAADGTPATPAVVVTQQELLDSGLAPWTDDPLQGTIDLSLNPAGDLFVAIGNVFPPDARNVVVRIAGAGASVPAVEVCLEDATGVEGDPATPGEVVFPLTLSAPLPEDVTVTYTVESGTATVGTGPDADLEGGTWTLELPAGTTEASVTIALIGDVLVEPDETFTVRLLSVTPPGSLGTCSSAVGTIEDDDVAPTVTAGADRAQIAEGDSTRLTAVVDNPTSELTYAWSPETGLDDPTSAEPTFTGPDDGTYTFTVEVCDGANPCDSDDVTVEVTNVAPTLDVPVADVVGTAAADSILAVEFTDPGVLDTFDLRIDWGDGTPKEIVPDVTSPAQATHVYATAGTYSAQVCVVDDDGAQDCAPFQAEIAPTVLPTISVSDATTIEGDPDGPATVLAFGVTLSEPSGGTVHVGVRTVDGTATAPSDYLAVDTTLSIPAGQTEAVVEVSVTRDLLAEPDETMTLVLADPVGAVLGNAIATGTILDDDLCTIVGTDGDDRLIGTPGDDVICGFGGDDIIDGRGGNDLILGGPGVDSLIFLRQPGPVRVDLSRGTARGSGLSYTLSGIENVTGTPYNDRLIGNDADNRLAGLGGNDFIDGRGGDDLLFGNEGDDHILGGRGDDRIFGNAGNDRLYGQDGNDEIYGLEGDDLVSGGNGDDLVSGGSGNDRLFGGAGNDRLFGGAGNDLLFGQDGDDFLSGGTGFDRLFGGRGIDTCLLGERNISCELP